MNRLFCVFVLGLAACATDPLPSGYSGPVAKLLDSVGDSGDTTHHALYSRDEYFFASAIDGKPIKDTLSATRTKSFGKGKNTDYDIINRDIPVRLITIKIEGKVSYAPPIFELTHAGSLYSVAKVIQFEPAEGRTYIVKGKLAETGSEVWLEDMRTGEHVGTKE